LPSVDAGTVALRFLAGGVWLPEAAFGVASGSEMIPMDRRLREIVHGLPPAHATVRERQEHVALLARWYYSTWRDGQWIAFPDSLSAGGPRDQRRRGRPADGAVLVSCLADSLTLAGHSPWRRHVAQACGAGTCRRHSCLPRRVDARPALSILD
jgi:hypothetical protein